MVLVTDAQRCIDWLEGQLGLKFVSPHCGFGYASATMSAAVVFTDYTGQDVHINLAGRKSLSRFALRISASIPFEQLGCRRLTALVRPSSDMDMMMPRLGFRFEGRLRCYYPDGSDAKIWGMLKEECHWF